MDCKTLMTDALSSQSRDSHEKWLTHAESCSDCQNAIALLDKLEDSESNLFAMDKEEKDQFFNKAKNVKPAKAKPPILEFLIVAAACIGFVFVINFGKQAEAPITAEVKTQKKEEVSRQKKLLTGLKKNRQRMKKFSRMTASLKRKKSFRKTL